MLESCQRHNVKVAVAHRRACAYEQRGKELVQRGEIGQVQSIKTHGKCDQRVGAMDLAVLGTHMNGEVTKCCSAVDARAALEMITAVHESPRLRSRVDFPLANRENPYDLLLSAG
jgi:hypothetical protein